LQKKLKRFLLYILPLFAWFTICTVLFTLPGSSLPKEDWLDKIYIDKWVHIGLFTILSFLGCRLIAATAPAAKWMRYFLMCGITCLAYGVAIEFIQKYFVPMRSFDVGDITADGFGSLIGTLYCIRRYIKK
jgi:VanZ family protein